MKTLNHLLNSKHSLSLSLLSALSLVIWFSAPLIMMGDHFPFQDPMQRLYLITLPFLIWSLKVFLLDTRNPLSKPTLTADQLNKLQLLQSRFQGAIQFLKKTFIKKQSKDINLHQLPWYLLLGPQSAGKTSLLANANVNFVLAKQFKQENLKQLNPSESCDWWVTRDLVLVDVPSHFIFDEKTDKPKPSAHRFLWQNLLGLIKKHRKTTPLNGVIITLNLPELLKPENQHKKEPILISLRNAILQIKSWFGQEIPFYLTITKCDLIPGFIEFFGDCGIDELSQIFGITIPPLHANEKLPEIFSSRFNALIKRLNKQLIWRLHQERNQSARPYIKDFPLQIERFKEALSNLLKALKVSNLNLQGVYLTSSVQPVNLEEKTTEPSVIQHQSTQTMPQLYHPSTLPSRAFFTKQLISQALLNTFEHQSVTKIKEITWQKRIALAMAVSAITLTAIILGHDFQQSVQQAYSLQNLLSQYQIALKQESTEIDHLINSLPLLDGLQRASRQSNPRFALFNNFMAFYSKKSQKTAAQIYHQALQTIVIPEIKNYLENYLQSPADKNPVRLYTALKAYLMLGNSQSFQNTAVFNALPQLLPNRFEKHQREKLIGHLQIALNELQPVQFDNNLVVQTRKLLLSLPRSQLAFIMLKNIGNNNIDSSLGLGTNLGSPAALTTKDVTNQIPNMFTAPYFQTILSNEIPMVVKETLHGNNTVGEIPARLDASDESILRQEIEKQYITNYVDIWESLLANIQINTPRNLSEADLLVNNLANNSSPLMQLLQTFQQNTTLPAVLNASPKLQIFNSLLANINNPGNTLYQIFSTLQELHNYLQGILQAPNTSEAALTIARTRMLTASLNDAITHMKIVAEQSPEPIKSWLDKLTDSTWRFILEETGREIQLRWKTNVQPSFATLANRFPFKENANNEADLKQFVNFFNPAQGILIRFYNAYLSPFVNDASKEWDWKRIDNQTLPLAKSILQKIQYAMKLQHALFPNGDNKLYVPFTLQPLSLSKDINKVSLNINGQLIDYEKSSPRSPRVLTWPGNNGLHAITLNFSTTDLGPVNEVYHGDWAWFRLVNKATQNIISRKELSLTFTINNHSAKYLLFVQGHLNPFLPLNWENLQLPESLT
jgi:type VI secretion system protein ImpL